MKFFLPFIKAALEAHNISKRFELQMKIIIGISKKVKRYRTKLTIGQLELLEYLAKYGVTNVSDLNDINDFVNAVSNNKKTNLENQAWIYGIERRENESDSDLAKRLSIRIKEHHEKSHQKG